MMSSKLQHGVIDSNIIIPGKTQWILCLIDKQKAGLVNVYVPNIGRERGIFSHEVVAQMPDVDCWVLGGDFNMVEQDSDRSGRPPKKLSSHEQEGWDTLTMRLGIEDTWNNDNCSYEDSLRFSSTNKQQGENRLMARLDWFYVGEWGRRRGGKIKILPGHNTISPIEFLLRKPTKRNNHEKLFKFNLTFLDDEGIVADLIKTWEEEKKSRNEGCWSLSTRRALIRIKPICQAKGRERAEKGRMREHQLRWTVALAQILLETKAKDTHLQETLEAAS